MIIDAHQHFWRPERGDYGWMNPADTVLYRDYLPEHLRAELETLGVAKTVLVQAAPSVAETEFMLDLAAQTDFIAGVVGWLDFEAADFANQLERLRAHPKFVGLRPMLQDIADDAYILRPAVLANLAHLADRGIAFDFLTLPRQLPYAAKAMAEVPQLRAVIDHLSKPAIAKGDMEPWASDLAAMARFPNVFCKLSGMVTEADHSSWTADDLEPYVDHALECFGPDRVMFGSDWPVALLAASYRQVFDALHDVLVPRLDDDELEAVFGGNAARFYDLKL